MQNDQAGTPPAASHSGGAAAPSRFALGPRLKSARLARDPFPHIVLENAVPPDAYRQLAETFPIHRIPGDMMARDNHRVDVFASFGKSIIPSREELSPAWRNFVEQNAVPSFAESVAKIFRRDLSDEKVKLLHRVKAPSMRARLAAWLSGNGEDADDILQEPVPADRIKVRVSLGTNTPVKTPSRVRGAHVDREYKAFVGLYYLKDPSEGECGGDLQLYRWKDQVAERPEWPSSIDDDLVEPAETVKYAANTLVLFLNSADSIHGVTRRFETPVPRRLVVVSGWFPSYVTDAKLRKMLGPY
ncbi:MAG: 2OG-Fe(II) oxygenase [Pseudomonadota bacterium]